MGDEYNRDQDRQNVGSTPGQQNQQQQGSGQSTYGQGDTNSGGDALQNDDTAGQTGGQSGAGYGDQGQQGQGGMANDDESRGGPPTGEQLGDDTGGLTSDEGSRTGGGMQQDAMGAAEGSEMDEDEDSDTLQGQTSSGAV